MSTALVALHYIGSSSQPA